MAKLERMWGRRLSPSLEAPGVAVPPRRQPQPRAPVDRSGAQTDSSSNLPRNPALIKSLLDCNFLGEVKILTQEKVTETFSVSKLPCRMNINALNEDNLFSHQEGSGPSAKPEASLRGLPQSRCLHKAVFPLEQTVPRRLHPLPACEASSLRLWGRDTMGVTGVT